MSSAKKLKAFSIFIIFVFVASLFYAGISLVKTASSRSNSLQQKSADITSKLKEMAGKNSLYSETYYEEIAKIIENDSSITAFIVYQDGSPSFVWPVGSSFIISDADKNPVISTDSGVIQVKDGFFITSLGVTKWSGAFAKITASDIYSSCSRAFIAILIGTVLCFMLFLYISLPKDTVNKPVSQEISCISDNSDSISDEEIYEECNDAYPYTVDLNDDIDTVFDEQDKEIVINDDNLQHDDENKPLPDEFVVEAAQHQASVHAAPKKRVLKESEDPLGLFSELTGFGWESYLETRLDSELIRAASSEYDLALFIVKIKDVKRTHPVYAEICSALLSFFKFRDMVFEYGNDSFAGIVTGMDINGCMGSVEGLFNSLNGILKANGIQNGINIGISTRSFRLIPGNRLLFEAKDAVTKAGEEKDMPIVAFRVNPGKYKEFLENEIDQVQEPIAS